MKIRFEQYEGLKQCGRLDNDSLKTSGDNLEAALKNNNHDNDTNDDRKSDIDANTLVSNMLSKISGNLKFGRIISQKH
jgi:hypothetical protein